MVIAVLGLALTGLLCTGTAASRPRSRCWSSCSPRTLLLGISAAVHLGPRVDRLRLPFLGRNLNKPAGGEGSLAWRWSHAVQRRPWPIVPRLLVALAVPALDMRLGFPDAGNDPPSTMTRQAYDLNTQGSRLGAPTGRW